MDFKGKKRARSEDITYAEPKLFREIVDMQLAAITGGVLRPEDIQGLHGTCGRNMLLAALDLIDYEDVLRLRLPNGRQIYSVAGSQQSYMITLGDLWHCPCMAFTSTVLQAEKHILCKHLLACLLADRLDKFKDQDISLDAFASYLQTMDI